MVRITEPRIELANFFQNFFVVLTQFLYGEVIERLARHHLYGISSWLKHWDYGLGGSGGKDFRRNGSLYSSAGRRFNGHGFGPALVHGRDPRDQRERQNAGNGLVKILAPVDLVNQLRQIAILLQFRKS